jgi:hypothetical protein
VARSGAVDPNDATYTFKWGANSRTFTVGKQPSDYAGTSSDGYLFEDVVDYVNTTLAGLDAGWSATLQDALDTRASSGSLLGLRGQGFGDTSCKAAPLQVVSNFDAHGDWFQQRFGTITQNLIAYDNVAYDMQTQNIFVSSTNLAQDFVFINCSLSNDPSGLEQFDETIVFSQIGRSNSSNAMSHIVIAHCSMPNQLLTFRNDGTAWSTFDVYCLVANNALRGLTKAVATAGREPQAIIRDNHIHAGQTPMPEAVGTTIGGDKNSLFGDFVNGDFTPEGDLLINLKAPVARFDQAGDRRGLTAPVGSLA